MRRPRLNEKSTASRILVPSIWSSRYAILHSIQTLNTCQQLSSSNNLNPKEAPLTRFGCDGKLQYAMYQHFETIRRAMDSFLMKRSIMLKDPGPQVYSDAYVLYVLTSPKTLEKYLSALIFWGNHKDKQLTSGVCCRWNHSEDFISLKHPVMASQIILAYSWFFYNQKTTRETDIRFLRTMLKIRHKDCYIQFARDIINRIINRTSITKLPCSARVTSCHSNISCLPPLIPSQITDILKVLAKNSYLYDQRIVLLVCAALSAYIYESPCWNRRYFTSKVRYPPLSSLEARDCIISLQRMQVYHVVVRDLLRFMACAEKPKVRTDLESTRKSAIWNVNHFIEAFRSIVGNRDLISLNDFVFFVSKIVIDRDNISTKSASHLMALIAARAIQSHYSLSDGKADCGSVGHDSGWSSQFLNPTPRFHSQETRAENSFSIQRMDANLITGVRDSIENIVIKKVIRMSVIQVARVVEGLTFDFPCIRSRMLLSSLLAQIKEIYSKSSDHSRQYGKKTIFRSLNRREKYFVQRKQLIHAHATLLAFLPRVEAYLESIGDYKEEKIDVSGEILSNIARCIPLKHLETHFRRYAKIILLIRRAYCDCPKLHLIEPRLWNMVKSLRIRNNILGKRKLYRFSLAGNQHIKDQEQIAQKTEILSKIV